MSVEADGAEGFVLGPEEGDAYWWLGTLTINKLDGERSHGRIDIVDHRVPAGSAPPRHVHDGQDEIFFVIDGQDVGLCCGRREGPHVPMATIAADAGLGVGTLYRRYPNREALLAALTHRSFELLREVALVAEKRDGAALVCLGWWWDRVIDDRDQLVLPLHGGPPVMSAETSAVRSQLHESLTRLLRRGQLDGSIRDDVTTRDLILFGAMLATPLPGAKDWTRNARRQKEIYVDGLAARPPASP